MALNNPPFKMLDLPTQICIHILSFLLPDLPVTECDVSWSPCYNEDSPFGMPAAYKLRSDDEPCYPETLRANCQLHTDGMTYLYAHKTYKITVTGFGFDFLKYPGELQELPLLPYHRIKEFVIQVLGWNLAETGCQLRSQLI